MAKKKLSKKGISNRSVHEAPMGHYADYDDREIAVRSRPVDKRAHSRSDERVDDTWAVKAAQRKATYKMAHLPRSEW